MLKRCYHCKIEKTTDNFYGDKYAKDGIKSCCKECTKERAKKWRIENPDKAMSGIKKWRSENITYLSEYTKHFHKGKLDSFQYKGQRKGRSRLDARASLQAWKSEYDITNRDKNSAYHRERAKMPGFREKVNERERKRRGNNPSHRVGVSFRSRVSRALKDKNVKKYTETMALLGCSIQQFRAWLECNFTVGMSWDNYGFGMKKWNIDHWRPCSNFNLEEIDQLKACFHWSNQFPEWQIDNLRKGGKDLGELSPERAKRIDAFAMTLIEAKAA